MIASCKATAKGKTVPRGRESGRRERGARTASLLGLLLGLLLALSWTGARGGSGIPGDLPYHNGPSLLCSDCHAPLAPADGRGSDLATEGGGPSAGPWNQTWSAESPHLKMQDVNLVCLSCHDNVRGIPDVMGADVNRLRERSGGMLETSGRPENHGHVLSARLTCISCHDPHGNGLPRNLRLPSRPETAPRLGLFVRPGSGGLERYERENVAYGTMDSPDLLEVSALCLDCHGGHAGEKTELVGGHLAYTLHPSYDSQHGAANRIGQGVFEETTSAVYWNEGAGPDFQILGRLPFVTAGASDFAAAATVDAGQNGVFCLSCHPAHGSGQAFALRWHQAKPEGSAGCNQCHAMGRHRAAGQITQNLPPEPSAPSGNGGR